MGISHFPEPPAQLGVLVFPLLAPPAVILVPEATPGGWARARETVAAGGGGHSAPGPASPVAERGLGSEVRWCCHRPAPVCTRGVAFLGDALETLTRSAGFLLLGEGSVVV